MRLEHAGKIQSASLISAATDDVINDDIDVWEFKLVSAGYTPENSKSVTPFLCFPPKLEGGKVDFQAFVFLGGD